MAELQPLGADHAAALLEFERANRAYFARSITDRGDDYFEQFAARHRELLEDQAAGRVASFVLVAADGAVLGRFTLHGIAADSADLGYRMAERSAGQGLATAAVGELCLVASIRYGLDRLRAATADANGASRRVLLKSGFLPVGPADPADIGGKRGTWYERSL